MRQCVGCRELSRKRYDQVIKTAAEDEAPSTVVLDMLQGGKTAEALMCVRTVSACARGNKKQGSGTIIKMPIQRKSMIH